jgi:hypothetical protein
MRIASSGLNAFALLHQHRISILAISTEGSHLFALHYWPYCKNTSLKQNVDLTLFHGSPHAFDVTARECHAMVSNIKYIPIRDQNLFMLRRLMVLLV